MGTDMNNKQVISILKRQDTIRKRLSSNRTKRDRLIKSIKKDENDLRKIDSVFGKLEKHHGKLLDIDICDYNKEYGRWCDVRALADDNGRSAHIYLNQHNKKTFGASLKVNTYGQGGRNENFLGAKWESFDDLLEVCIKFVAIASFDYIGTDFMDRDFKKTVKKYMKDEI